MALRLVTTGGPPPPLPKKKAATGISTAATSARDENTKVMYIHSSDARLVGIQDGEEILVLEIKFPEQGEEENGGASSWLSSCTNSLQQQMSYSAAAAAGARIS
jgi:hypothetical protein